MAYDTKQLEKQAIEAIKKHNLFFITDVSAFLPCTTSTFYEHELEKSEAIKEALEENKISTKNSMRAKWYKSDNATLQVALMKLISEDDERKKLSQSYTDLTTGGEPIKVIWGGNEDSKD
jgi:hypothetical protein